MLLFDHVFLNMYVIIHQVAVVVAEAEEGEGAGGHQEGDDYEQALAEEFNVCSLFA
jgi:hypothetical protein